MSFIEFFGTYAEPFRASLPATFDVPERVTRVLEEFQQSVGLQFLPGFQTVTEDHVSQRFEAALIEGIAIDPTFVRAGLAKFMDRFSYQDEHSLALLLLQPFAESWREFLDHVTQLRADPTSEVRMAALINLPDVREFLLPLKAAAKYDNHQHAFTAYRDLPQRIAALHWYVKLPFGASYNAPAPFQIYALNTILAQWSLDETAAEQACVHYYDGHERYYTVFYEHTTKDYRATFTELSYQAMVNARKGPLLPCVVCAAFKVDEALAAHEARQAAAIAAANEDAEAPIDQFSEDTFLVIDRLTQLGVSPAKATEATIKLLRKPRKEIRHTFDDSSQW